MTDTLELRHALADRLIDDTRTAMSAVMPAVFAQDEVAKLAAVVTANAIRTLIGRTVRRFPAGPERDAVKVALAPLLGDAFGQLIAQQPALTQLGCINAHSNLLGKALGSDAPIVTTPPVKPSHLKVVH